MCGIAGFVDYHGSLDSQLLHRMQASLHHRGPDDKGHILLAGDKSQVGLAHTRLSILDLSEGGHQPMRFGSFTIVFNGEIYNFREIRSELIAKGHLFSTDCDTEVILHAFAEWGIDCLHRFIGMFAFALHDASRRRLYLVRDRAGVKPLYVYPGATSWLFGSELKALRASPQFRAEISLPDLHCFFRHGHVPDGRCIYRDCCKVDAGTYWVLDLETNAHKEVRWWDQTRLHEQPKSTASFEDATEELESLLKSACAYRMVSDVPVGIFLSGGYDSTAVTAILQSQSTRPIKTFTIGFTEGNDEAPFARRTAERLGTDHQEFYCSPQEAMDVVFNLPDIYDEPFADSSGIPTLLVSRLASPSVKVAMSADGGDELFCGYRSYLMTARRARLLNRIPASLRRSFGNTLSAARVLCPRSNHAMQHKLTSLANSLSPNEALMAQRLHGSSRLMPKTMVDELLPDAYDGRDDFPDKAWPPGTHYLEAAMGIDYQAYLKDDILTKVDRATMSLGLEGREPLLDHRLANFCARLPMDYKYNGVTQKRILKNVVHKYIPKELMDRPKSGFSLPIMSWMRKELKPLVEDVCSQEALQGINEGYARTAKNWLHAFNAGNFHYSPLIWRLFVFQAWRRKWTNR